MGKDGEPYWFWEWSGEERDSPKDYEPMCPAEDVAQVTQRVIRVLALASTT